MLLRHTRLLRPLVSGPRLRQVRSLVAAPRPGDGPLMERRADRELPSVKPQRRWLKTIPVFLGILTASALAIFNYQKSSSPVVNSTLYALRTNPTARSLLGDEIYFASQIPWIWGEMNQLHGRIDINFMVKGTKGEARMYFRCSRNNKTGVFSTQDWSLETADGQYIQLLELGQGDPLAKSPLPS